MVILDTNKDVRQGDIKDVLLQLCLNIDIMAKHGQDATLTYEKDRAPIDRIFVSPTLHIAHGWYLPYGQYVSLDH